MRRSMDSAPLISIIIPALNEAANIGAAIRSARGATVPHEIIVVDARSTDDTVRIAEEEGGRVVSCAHRQRAAQMNLGANSALGSVLLFLHADTRLGAGAMSAIDDALRDPRVFGGAFARRYDSPSRFLAATCWLASLRNRLIGWHLGDQAIFVRAAVFQRCGAFPEVALFEDLAFSRKLARCGRVVTLVPPVLSSARRFAKGAALRTAQDFLLTCRYLLRGLPPASDARLTLNTTPPQLHHI